MLVAVVASWVTELQAATLPVTFSITRVKELDCDEGFGESCPNDFYPKVDIDAQGLDDGKSRFCCAHGTDFQPNWVFTRAVDTTHDPFNIHVELWDQDDLGGDDQLAITNGPRSLDISVNVSSCTWKGGGLKGFLNTQSSSSGSGSDSAQLYFMIDVPSVSCNDSDGDGLLDGWETNGFDADGNGTIDVNLPAMGTSAQRKDLFLEIDYLGATTLGAANHTHAPREAAIRQVVQAFANAGIQLHIDVGSLYGVGPPTNVVGVGGVTGTFGDYGGGGNQIEEAGNEIVDYDGAAGNPGTNFFTIKNFNANRDNIFRYAIFVHQTNQRRATNDCTSGVAKGIPGVNFMVSLGGVSASTGSPCWGTDAAGQSVGGQAQQAGTLMHEFGHALGLQHGGGDDINNKPNYLSVMTYVMQACGVPAVPAAGSPGGCDYSRVSLPALDENSLDECQGIDHGVLGLGTLDWNNNGRLEGVSNCQPPNATNVQANINGDTSSDTNNNGTQDPSEPPIFSELKGFQDWNAVVYNFRTITDFTTAGAPSDQEPDPQTIENARAFQTRLMQPKLTVDKTGPADAGPGDMLAYNIKVDNRLENGARGPALNVVVTDTKPDASTQVLNLGTMVLTATINNPVSFVVPCSTKDGTVLTNTARVTGQDMLANPIIITDAHQTTIHAPVLTLATTATAGVNAGEAIAYTINYQNTGSGAATNVLITNTVPADVYYSPALDLGTGPRPTTVTLNADGTRTLVWNIGGLAANSAPRSINFTGRPTLLALGSTMFTNHVLLTFNSGPVCMAPPLNASASSRISVVALVREPPDTAAWQRNPEELSHWRRHPEEGTAEILARIQATDQRYDGRDMTAPDGALTQPEVQAALKQKLSLTGLVGLLCDRPKTLDQVLLALYFNLATRRLNAGMTVSSGESTALGLTNVRDAALHARATLLLPFDRTTKKRYNGAIELLEAIND